MGIGKAVKIENLSLRPKADGADVSDRHCGIRWTVGSQPFSQPNVCAFHSNPLGRCISHAKLPEADELYRNQKPAGSGQKQLGSGPYRKGAHSTRQYILSENPDQG
jgi:hypothetical protein